MRCPKCQFDNREGAKFCNECGHKFELTCPECGVPNRVGSNFCDECGYDLSYPKEAPSIDYSEPQSYTPKFLADKILTSRSSIEGERKLVTVLFADVASYTAMSEKLDPEEVHQIMDGCFEILMDEIHKYEGTINQFTGDGVMALFGAPVSHEDHAQRACRAALSVQGTMGEYGEKIKKDCGIGFKMRIGLNSGTVIVGAIGDDLRMDYTAVGDTTNLAMRMQTTAEPGKILVSAKTHRLAKDFFEFKPLGKIKVKGKAKPQEIFELIKPGEVVTRIEAAAARGLTRFVGRKNSMAALMEAYEKVKSGSGQVVGMVGEAGVGKSRLLLEFRNRLPQGEYTYLEGRCLHYGGTMPYLPILDILRSYFGIEEGDREFLIKRGIGEKIQHLDENLKGMLPCFQDLLSLKVEDEDYLKLEPKQKREKAFEAIRELLIREGQKNPLFVTVEDLHWIDKSSEEFLSYLIGGLAHTRVLLILLYRPEYTHQWSSKSYYKHIGLDQLTMKSSAELVQAMLKGSQVAAELRELILSRAAGNPLFMEELTHTLLENGSIEKIDRQLVLSRKVSEIRVPDTIQGIIAARMDRLEENLKRTMQVASVIGRDFAFRILQTITGMREELKSYLLNLEGLEFIYEKQLFPELEYIFKHALTQEVAYNSLLVKRRGQIHKRIGEAIEKLYAERLEEFYEMLAYHYRRSDDKGKSLEYLELASQKAIKICAMEEAIAYFKEAMKLLDTLPETEVNQKRRVSFLVSQRIPFLQLLKIPEYYELLTKYKPLVTRLGDQALAGAFYISMGTCEWYLNLLDQAIQSESKAKTLCKEAGNLEGTAGAIMLLAWAHLLKGDLDQVLLFKEEAVRLMEQQFNFYVFVRATAGSALAHLFLGRWDEALQEGQKAFRVAEKFSDNSTISFAAWIISMIHSHQGDLDQAVEYGELAVEKAPTPADKAWAQATLALAWCRAGEPHRGVEVLEKVVPMLGVRRAVWETYLGEGYWLAGEYEKARRKLEECLELAERSGMKLHIGLAHRLLGEVALEANPVQVAESLAAPHFEKSITVLQKIKAENELALAYAAYRRLHKQQGSLETARKYLNTALEIFERLGTLIEPEKIRKELSLLPDV